MTWIKIDDSFPDHPKIIGLTDKAFRTHIQGLCYCGRFLTDGFIPFVAVQLMATNPETKPTDELEAKGLWLRNDKGFLIVNYLEHQTSKRQVEDKREANRERVNRYRKKKTAQRDEDIYDWEEDGNADTNAFVTRPEYREQNTENREQNTDKDKQITTSYGELEEIQYVSTLPRIKTAREAVESISNRLSEARANGINAWNLSRLVEDEWDKLHNANDIGGCIALTAWYVSELQSRKLSSVEIGRIGQMTKRFGRIGLLAIDEAASKDLTDLVSYAYRVAQNLYKERQGK